MGLSSRTGTINAYIAHNHTQQPDLAPPQRRQLLEPPRRQPSPARRRKARSPVCRLSAPSFCFSLSSPSARRRPRHILSLLLWIPLACAARTRPSITSSWHTLLVGPQRGSHRVCSWGHRRPPQGRAPSAQRWQSGHLPLCLPPRLSFFSLCLLLRALSASQSLACGWSSTACLLLLLVFTFLLFAYISAAHG